MGEGGAESPGPVGEGGPHMSRLQDVVRTAAALPGAAAASVTMLRHGRFRTLATTGEPATSADALQMDVGAGPSVDVVTPAAICRIDDVGSAGARWLPWGLRASAEAGVGGVLSYRLAAPSSSRTVAALNIYGGRGSVFDHTSVSTGLMLASLSSLLLTADTARERAEHLRDALQANREIGLAMGRVMQAYRLPRAQAFELLRAASRDTDRTVAEVARDVVEMGPLATLRRPWDSGRQVCPTRGGGPARPRGSDAALVTTPVLNG
jgi:hypothetical protein